MRIALVHHSLRRGGGMERYLLDLIKGFAAAGDQIDVYARRIDEALTATLPITAHRLHAAHWLRPLASTWFAGCVPVDELRQNHDQVLTLSRVPGCTAYICGGTHPGYLAATRRRAGLRDRLEIRLEAQTVQSARLNVAHSRLLANELERYYGMSDTTVVIYPPVDTARFQFPSDVQRRAARARFGVTAARKSFLFPSMDHRRKGLDVLLAASARVDAPHEVLIAGRPPHGFPQSKRLRSLGYVDDMPALYSAVDATVLPSRYEPFGLVIAESLACGTPVIISGDAGVAELIGSDHGIALADASVDTLTAALERACEHHFVVPAEFTNGHRLDLNAHVDALRTTWRQYRN